ncbi:MAG TPA: DUF481 domain-containing protein [Kofleriaceae bacterium]|nr:DUF481 domain-containing protein [Kofleriaceae bacterium]
MNIRSFVVGMAAILAASHVAHAQPAPSGPPTYEKKGDVKDVKDVEEVVWTAKGEAGVVATTGNSRTTVATISGNATRKDEDNKLEINLTGTYARATTRTATDLNADGFISEDELSDTTAVSAKNANAKLRYDRYLDPLDSLYVAALAGIDQPAGKDFAGGGQIGYSRSLYATEGHQILGEIAYDLTYVSLSAGDSATIHSARLFAGYTGKIGETALEASGEALVNGTTVTYGMREAGFAEATRLTGIVGVTTALSTKISVAASFTAKYDRFPAPLAKIGPLPFAPGFEPPAESLDTITKLTLIVKFL